MDRLNILVTGIGAPGAKGTIYSLKNNYDNRKIKIVGTDSKSDTIGKYLCQEFFLIPNAYQKDKYLSKMLEIAQKEKIDVILPQNTKELNTLSQNVDLFSELNVKIVISPLKAIQNSNNKYKLLEKCIDIGIPVGQFYLVNTFKDLIEASKKLNWPKEKVVVKPPESNGSRGVRVINEKIDLRDLFYKEKPTSIYTKMDHLKNILGEEFPELIVSEFHYGDEYTVDVFNDEDIIVIPRKRSLIKSGITFNGKIERHQQLIEYSKILTEELELKYCFGYQFIFDNTGNPKLIECNPRVQGTMVMSTLAGANIIYSAIKAVLGEEILI